MSVNECQHVVCFVIGINKYALRKNQIKCLKMQFSMQYQYNTGVKWHASIAS